MKKIFYPLLFLISFLATLVMLLNVDDIKHKVVEKIAHVLEKSFNAKIFFNQSEPFVCKNILFKGSQTFCIEQTEFSLDPLSLLSGNIYFNHIALKGIEHRFNLEGKLLFHLPHQISGHFLLDQIPIDLKGDLQNGLRVSISASKDEYTLFAENTMNDLTVFLTKNDEPLFQLFAPFNATKQQLESTFQGTLHSKCFKNNFTGTFNTDFESLHLTLEPNSPLETLENLIVKLDGTPKNLNLEIMGDFEKLPFKIYGPLQLEQRQIKLNELSLTWFDFDGSLKALIDLDEKIVQAKSALFSNYFKYKLEGYLRLNCELCANFDESFIFQTPLIHLDIDTSLAGKNWSVKGLKARLNLDDIDGDMLGSFFVKCDTAILDQFDFKKLNFKWEINGNKLSPFILEGLAQKEPLLARGQASIVDEGMTIQLEQLTTKFKGVPITLEKQASFYFDGERGSIEQMALAFGTSKCALSYKWDDETTSLMLDSPALNLTLIHQLFEKIPVKGFCHGRLQLDTKGQDFQGSLLGKIKQLEVLDVTEMPLFPLDGDLNIKFNDKQANVRCDCIGPFKEEIKIQGSLPLLFDRPIYACFDEEGPIDFHVDIQGELSPFLKTLLSDTTLATGDTDCQITIKGSIKDPLVYGDLTIKNGSYESLVLGCSFQDIDAKFSLTKQALICESLTGKDSIGGLLRGRGRLDFTSKLPFNLELNASSVQILHLDYANATASGPLNFKGNHDAGILEGSLTLDAIDIRLPDVTPTRLNAIEVEYINQSELEKAPTMVLQPDEPWPLFLDIQLFFPDNAFVRASSFESEWRGRVELKGSTDDPLIFGESKILNGHFLFNGTNFSSNEGTVHFNGSPARKTSLYLIAKHQIDDLEIGVILKGPIREPEISFRSNPPKSTREILSWLLFNKGVGDIDSLQSEELTQNIIKLSDQISSGPNLLDRFRSSFGIDRIDITSTNSDDMSVRVGKYLTNRLFLSVKKSMNDQPNQASIEADLTHNFKAQAEVGDDAEARLMLKWERDY